MAARTMLEDLSFVAKSKPGCGRNFWTVARSDKPFEDSLTGARLALEYLRFEATAEPQEMPNLLNMIVANMPRDIGQVEISFFSIITYALRGGVGHAARVAEHWKEKYAAYGAGDEEEEGDDASDAPPFSDGRQAAPGEPDPFLARMARYMAEVDAYNALPDDLSEVDDDEPEPSVALRLELSTGALTIQSIEGAAEAMRYLIAQDTIHDMLDEQLARSISAFLDGRALK